MATGLEHITRAMQHLSLLAAGAVPSTDQQTLGLTFLNIMLENWTAEGLLGFSNTVARTTRTTSVSVATNVITTVETPEVTTTTLTKTAVATYASVGANNTYPTGWDEAIPYNLALSLAGPFGVVQISPLVVEKAKMTKAAITPPIPGVAA